MSTTSDIELATLREAERKFTCPCCKQPHEHPIACAWKPLAEQRKAERDEARAELAALHAALRRFQASQSGTRAEQIAAQAALLALARGR